MEGSFRRLASCAGGRWFGRAHQLVVVLIALSGDGEGQSGLIALA
jgi:hypothetical protein